MLRNLFLFVLSFFFKFNLEKYSRKVNYMQNLVTILFRVHFTHYLISLYLFIGDN